MGEKQILAVATLIFILSAVLAHADAGVFGKLSVPAVTNEGKGVITELEVEIIPGKGRILFNSEPFTGIQTQNSERVAQLVAENFTGVNLSSKDVILTFRVPAISIDGPSAGAAMTVLLISVLENKTIRNDTTLSGTIQPDGNIGPVGGIFEKAEAAHNLGFKYFLIPRSQEIVEQNVDEEFSPSAGQTAIRTIVRSRNITKHAEENWDMKVIPVSDIVDVHEIMVEGKNVVSAKRIPQHFAVLEAVDAPPRIHPFKPLATDAMRNASDSLEIAKSEYFKSSLEPGLLSEISDLIDESEREWNSGTEAFKNGYLYGAANHFFRSRVFSKTAKDALLYYALDSKAQQKAFLEKRTSEVLSGYRAADAKFKTSSWLANDTGAYEWVSSAQSRFSQAEEQLNTLSSTEGSLYELSLAEGWTKIATGLLEIGENEQSGYGFDHTNFKTEAEGSILDLDKLIGSYTQEPPSGTIWLLKVSKREFTYEWFISAFIDSEIAHKRIDAERDLNTKTFVNYTDFVEAKINSISESNSPWARLYKDQAKLTLYYAKRDQSFEALNAALAFANQAKIYADISKRVEQMPTIRQKPGSYNLNYVLLGIFALGLVLIGLFYFLTRDRDIGPRRWHLH